MRTTNLEVPGYHHKPCRFSYLYDLGETLRRGLGQQSQAERAVQLPDHDGQREGERGVGRPRRRGVLGHGQELTGAVQHGRQHLERTRAHLEGQTAHSCCSQMCREEAGLQPEGRRVVPLAKGLSV